MLAAGDAVACPSLPLGQTFPLGLVQCEQQQHLYKVACHKMLRRSTKAHARTTPWPPNLVVEAPVVRAHGRRGQEGQSRKPLIDSWGTSCRKQRKETKLQDFFLDGG